MTDTNNQSISAKRVPQAAVQHVTAGPYSPVIEVRADRLIVVSGQVAVDLAGNVVGTNIEEQTEATLANCRRQLATADATLADVFKVNIYLADLTDWHRFNVVYGRLIPSPFPVRTTVQAILLPGFRVEIEMWAAKKDGS